MLCLSAETCAEATCARAAHLVALLLLDQQGLLDFEDALSILAHALPQDLRLGPRRLELPLQLRALVARSCGLRLGEAQLQRAGRSTERIALFARVLGLGLEALILVAQPLQLSR